jgi:GNAT superfamily N-acetyltransferase
VFRRVPALAWIADAPPMSEDEHLQLITQGHVWVAQRQLVHAQPVGFLAAQVLGHALHIRELSVHPDWQGRGVGTGLLAQARQQVHRLGLPCLTLTTFRDVPWNAPWYSRLGFEPAPDEPRLAELLRIEAEHGLATHPRVAMRLRLA